MARYTLKYDNKHQSHVCRCAQPNHALNRPPNAREFDYGKDALELEENSAFGKADGRMPHYCVQVHPLCDVSGPAFCLDGADWSHI